MNVGNRSKAAVLRAPFHVSHYRALLGMLVRYPDVGENLRRFLRASGEYPYACRVRTPVGLQTPTLYSSHDISTVNEVFCREDYRARRDLEVAVDIGANIGIASLYFLTRNTISHVYAFEPDPKNVERLRQTLAAYPDRYVLDETAIGLQEGSVAFTTEPSGRYGRISDDDSADNSITVRCREINNALGTVLDRERMIDVLKIDTEGTEAELVAAIRPEFLDRINVIYYETNERAPLHSDRYKHRFAAQTNRLTRR